MRISCTVLTILCFVLMTTAHAQVIENFEDGNKTTNTLGGYWYSFNDNNDGGKSRLKQSDWKNDGFVNAGSHDGSSMLSVDLILEKASYQWAPYFGLATTVDKSGAINPKNFAGISYWHKGVGHSFKIDIPEVTDYDNHQIVIPTTTKWTKVVIDFSTLTQEGWGKKVDLNLDNSIKLIWNLNKESGTFKIDDVEFVKEIVYKTPTAGEEVLIENFQDDNKTANTLGGYWYSFSDNDNGGKSSLKQSNWQQDGFVSTGSHDNSAMMNLDVTLQKADYPWSPFYAIATNVHKSGSINPKNFAGISYWHKGVAHSFRVDIPEVKDYDNHQIDIPKSDVWKKVIVDFSYLNQEGWGKRVDLNLDNSVKLVWNLNKESGSFQIDDVNFMSDIVYEKEFDMEVRPAEIPEPVEILGNVNTKLNSLSKKYLTKGMNFTNWGEQEKIESTDPSSWKFNEAAVKKQADQGLLGIRLPIDFDLYIVDRAAVLKGTKKEIEIEPLLYTILDSMNIWTQRYGLSLTIDYHAYDGTYNRAASKNPVFKETMASLWRVVAEHFVDEKREDLFLELTNEPGLSLPPGEEIDQSDWTSLAQMMIDSIRTVDKKRPLIFGDTKWYSLDELIKNKPFTDKNIIYCFHMYDPFLFTHQGASWSQMGTMKNIPFPYSEEKWSTEFRDFGITEGVPDWVKNQARNYYKEGNKQHIKNRLATVKNWAYQHNVPLICNEWGAFPRSAKLEDLNAYFKTMGEIFQEMDISWQVWFGVMDNDFTLLPGMAEALDLEQK